MKKNTTIMTMGMSERIQPIASAQLGIGSPSRSSSVIGDSTQTDRQTVGQSVGRSVREERLDRQLLCFCDRV